ncbi:MAG TPA: hypothetical protein VF384_18230 [Planctomycetota bacterium]
MQVDARIDYRLRVRGGTTIGDHIEFAPPGGPFASLLSRWLVEPDLQRIFRHRLQRIVDRFGGDAGRGVVAIASAARFR